MARKAVVKHKARKKTVTKTKAARTAASKPSTKSGKTNQSGPGQDLTPLDYMLRLLRDEETSVENRKWAAYHAAPYCHSKLSTVDHSGDVTVRHEDALKELE